MPDIRLSRPRGNRLWFWIAAFAGIGFILWASAFIVGDATAPANSPKVGAAIGFGANRSPVLPAQPVPFRTMLPLQTRDLGRLVKLRGVVESRVNNSAWIRAEAGRRILVRFEPAPAPELLRRVSSGSSVELDGYLQKISVAEFEVWMDSLRVRIPRPPPGRKFGDLPDPAFARVDSLFVKNFYISVRPEALEPRDRDTTRTGQTAP